MYYGPEHASLYYLFSTHVVISYIYIISISKPELYILNTNSWFLLAIRYTVQIFVTNINDSCLFACLSKYVRNNFTDALKGAYWRGYAPFRRIPIRRKNRVIYLFS